MKKIILGLVIIFTTSLIAKDIIRIEVGNDYKSYSEKELRKRVWRLEQAVWQMQQRIYNLESNGQTQAAPSWICTVEAQGDKFTGTGASKAVAKHATLENCKKGNNGSAFFCDNIKCEQ